MEEKKYNFSGYHILIVEDIPMLRSIEAKRLSLVGFEVDQAANGKEAVEMYLAHGAWYYQAILMDIIMPIMDGREATRIIRSSLYADALCVPIISISIDNSEKSVEESLASGIDLFLGKPIEFTVLFDKLEMIINSFSKMSYNIKKANTQRYTKLWKKLIDNNMTKTELREKIKCSTATLAKLSKGQKVSISILNKICEVFNCHIEDIMDEN